MKAARIVLNDAGDYVVEEYSKAFDRYYAVRSFVFKENADALVDRIVRYHADKEAAR